MGKSPEGEPFESDIKRETPEVAIRFQYAGKEVRFICRYDNTMVFTHSEDCDEYDHVFCYGAAIKEGGYWIFRDASGDFAFGLHLVEQGFDHIYRTYPTATDEKRWWEQQRWILGKEILCLEYGGIPWEEKDEG
jgi:hypothetical protein